MQGIKLIASGSVGKVIRKNIIDFMNQRVIDNLPAVGKCQSGDQSKLLDSCYPANGRSKLR